MVPVPAPKEPQDAVSLSEGIYVRFDGPPGPESGRFIETEDENGHGVGGIGWHQDGDDWLLGPFDGRITNEP